MPERYRVRLPDGQVFDKHATPAAIRKAHPEGRIEGRIVMDEVGQGRVVPYGGEQPVEANAPTDYNELTVAAMREEIERRGLDKPPSDAKKADIVAILETEERAPHDEGEKSQP